MQSALVAGDTLAFTVSLSDYPASAGWVLNYRLTPRAVGGTARSFAGTASGDTHAVSVPAATTANWAAGAYTCSAWVTGPASARYSVPSEGGQVVIAPDPSTLAVGTDTRSQAEVALAAVRSMLSGKAANGVERYAINGRELRHYPLADLLRLEQKLKTDVDSERAAAGLPRLPGSGIQRIRTRFTRES